MEIRGVDIWVTSEFVNPSYSLFFFFPRKAVIVWKKSQDCAVGVKLILAENRNLKLGFPAHVPTPGHVTIPYPLILIHALQTANADRSAGVYLQIQCAASDDGYDDAGDNVNDHVGNEEDEDITATLIINAFPPSSSSTTPNEVLPDGPASSSPSDSGVEAGEIYNALTACANLHPDVNSDVDQRLGVGDGFMFGNETVGDDGGGSGDGWVNGSGGGSGSGSGLPPPVPGSGGWITAENMDTYFDAEGNYRGVGRLEDEEGDGEASEREEEPLGQGAGIVRRRDENEGGDEEGKWRRTG